MTSPPARLLLPLLSLLLLLPLHARAQAPAGVTTDLRIGLASPKGDLGDLHDEGFFAGAGVGYRILPRLELRLEGGFENLERGGRPNILGGVKGPEADLWHVTALAAVELTEPGVTPWEVDVGVGGGATVFVVERGETIEAQRGTWPTVQGAFLVGFHTGGAVTLFLRIDGYLMLEDTAAPAGYLSKELSLINAAGIRLGL